MDHEKKVDRTPERDDVVMAAFERTVLPLAGDLHRRAYTYTHNVADAEDLVQETLLRAFRAFDRLGEDPQLKAWLLCILRNVWISKHRALRSRPPESLVGTLGDDQWDMAADGAHSAEHLVLRDMPDPTVRAALSALPDPVRLTVYYIAVVGMSCREVAAVMDVPEGTVMSRMHRGRLRLRRSLHDRRPLSHHRRDHVRSGR
jgi:RNA polymerase sigma-70 factor (ECF subfamily)